jgi:hypothetical protein
MASFCIVTVLEQMVQNASKILEWIMLYYGLRLLEIILTFYSLPVMWCTNRFNIQQLYVLPTLYLCICIYLRTNSDLCHLQHKRIGFYNRVE